MSAAYVVTVNVRFELPADRDPMRPEALAREIADRLMEQRAVATVRLEGERMPSVYRVDVDAATAGEAVEAVGALTAAMAWGEGVVCEVLSIDAVREDERPSDRSDDQDLQLHRG